MWKNHLRDGQAPLRSDGFDTEPAKRGDDIGYANHTLTLWHLLRHQPLSDQVPPDYLEEWGARVQPSGRMGLDVIPEELSECAVFKLTLGLGKERDANDVGLRKSANEA